MGDPASNKDPWAKIYAERGQQRPALVDFSKVSGAKRDTPRPAPKEPKPAVAPPLSAELAKAVAAMTATIEETDLTLAPFIPAERREEIARAARHHMWWRGVQVAAVVGVLALAAHLTVTRTLVARPGNEALAAQATEAGLRLLPLISSATQPFAVASTKTRLLDEADSSHLRYEAVAQLTLREPLYEPAQSNGTSAYRQLQESLNSARLLAVKLGPDAPDLPVPELPQLLEMTHTAGETVVLRAPFTAERVGWHWNLGALETAAVQKSRTMEGATLATYAIVPHLLFGPPENLPEIRRLMTEAKTYIRAINNAALRVMPAAEAAAAGLTR